MLVSIPMNVILCDNKVSEFNDPYMDECEYEWPWVGMRMGTMAVLYHASLTPDYVTSVSNHFGPVPIISFLVLPHVFRKEYGLVSCKPLSWYTPKRRGRDDGSMALD